MSEPIQGEELTPEQSQQWQDTLSLMAWTAPGFRHIFYKLLANNDGKYVAVPTRAVPIAATDAKNILINPDTFFKYSLKERAFILAHEIVHNVYGDVELLHRCKTAGKVPMHGGKELPFDNKTMQHAMDYRINALLKESKIGTPPKACLLDPKMAGPNDSVLEVYGKLYKKKKEDGDLDGEGFDELLSPGASTGQTPSQAQRNAQQWAVETAAAQTIEQMRSQGKMAGALRRMFKDILEPEIPWTEHIQSIFARKVGTGSYDWKRPDRRFIVRDIHMPSRSGKGAGWLVVWGDTSGSIGASELNKYLGELSGIIEDTRPRRLTVIWCDAAISHIDELEEAMDLQTIKRRGVGGGGGTSCDPVFKWIADSLEVPDMFIGFTDGYVTFPKMEPTFPVIWASVSDVKYPWGDVVRIHP
jgi:predicted metal-dependent peptidase